MNTELCEDCIELIYGSGIFDNLKKKVKNVSRGDVAKILGILATVATPIALAGTATYGLHKTNKGVREEPHTKLNVRDIPINLSSPSREPPLRLKVTETEWRPVVGSNQKYEERYDKIRGIWTPSFIVRKVSE